MQDKPKIAVTMGDPAGVGPEICLDLLADRSIEDATPIVFGDRVVLEHCAEVTGKPLTAPTISSEEIATTTEPAILDLRKIDLESFTPGTVNKSTGAATYAYIDAAIGAALNGEVAAVTTAPANKEALRSAGVTQPGQTEIFAERTNSPRFCMLQYSDIITCSFVTVHTGYAEVPELLNTERIVEVIQLTRNALRGLRRREPELVVCGLNPHAGENGLFGNREEEDIIIPAIEETRSDGAKITGPLPPDTAFLESRRAETDAFICMYHDQGHIPLKALAFDRAVNCTLGLPFPRTSVDHGTALDIAWQGKANPRSMKEAVKLAATLAGQA
ncbi:MAG: 4-hydroxythreonine-4-phosphate dehydrogenase PdxA [Verrucomicrobiota bacterium]